MAVSIKGALDGLLVQFAADQKLDLEAYGAELVALFERAIQPDPQTVQTPPPPRPADSSDPGPHEGPEPEGEAHVSSD
jgi:hypothetical protein